MPNEFKVKNGLIVDQGGAVITGSLVAPNITGSLLGTASYALVAQTLLGTVVSASYAATASYLLGGSTPFLTSTQIAFGNASNLLTSNANFTLTPDVGLDTVRLKIGAGGMSDVAADIDSNSLLVKLGDCENSSTGTALTVDQNNNSCFLYNGLGGVAKFGINTNSPTVALDVSGSVILDNAGTGYFHAGDYNELVDGALLSVFNNKASFNNTNNDIKVGINVSAPDTALHVEGSIVLDTKGTGYFRVGDYNELVNGDMFAFQDNSAYFNNIDDDIKVGINTMSPGVALHVVGSGIYTDGLTIAGSAAITGSLTVTGSVSVTAGITGSLQGTSSWASNAVTASFALNAVSSSFAANGGVTQIIAGSNITVSPTTGKGQVTISSIGGGGSSFNTATGSYGSFYDTTTQTNVASTARSMSLNTTDISNGVSISGSTNPFNTYIKTENPGVYDIQFSAQVDKTDSGTDEIWIWLRKNGINVSDSATSIQLVGNGAHYVAAWNFFVNAAANDYFQLMWYSPDANVRLHAEAGFGVVPGIPSVIVTVNRVDQFLSNTGSFSGSFTGNFTGSLLGTATTASYVLNAVSASYALSSSFATTASYVLNAISASFATTASFAVSALTASLATNAIPLAGTTNTSPLTGRIRTTNEIGVWRQWEFGGGDKSLYTGVIYGASNVPVTQDSSINQGVHVGNVSSSGLSDIATSTLLASTTDYDGYTESSRIYAESIMTSGVGTGKVVVNAGQGLIGAADYSATYTTNSFIQQGYLNTVTSSLVRNSQTSSMTVLSSSFATTSSFVRLAQSASYVLNAVSASFAPGMLTTGAQVIEGEKTFTGSFLNIRGVGFPTSGLKIKATNTAGAAYANFEDANGQYFDFGKNASGLQDAYFYTPNAIPLNFYTNGTIRFTVGSGGVITFSNLAGVGSRMVTADATGNLSTAAIPSGGSTFPFTGSAVITGSLTVTGSLNVTAGITGSLLGTASFAVSASWAPGGAGASPGGTTGEIQFNNAGSFGGAANVEIASGNLQLVSTTDPAAPSAGNLLVYSKDIAGRQTLKVIGPSGVDTPIQSSLYFNQVSVIGPAGNNTVGVIGCTVTSVGTISNPNIATTNLKTQTRRIVNTSAATAGSLASTRIATLECWRGNVAGQGGFFTVARFGFTTLQTGQRMFIGLDSNGTGTPTNIDYLTSTATAKIGMYATGSTGNNWNLIHNTAAAVPTSIPLGASFPVDTTSLIEMVLFAKPNDTVVTYRITNLSTNAAVSGSLSSNLPASTAPLGRLIAGCNNATAAAIAWDLSRFSLETDY